MEQSPSKRLEELIRERARVDIELERYWRLLAILFADIAGSTGFYDKRGDVAGVVMVHECLDLLVPVIEHHGGVVVKTIGDAILARFDGAETAVRCAVGLQRSVAEWNRERILADRIHIRIAINLGLALLKENDVFGDVVNVTSRIESATEPDEIAISPSVYEKIQHLPDIRVRKKVSGAVLKGKAEKLDLYAVLWPPDETGGPPPPRPSIDQLALSTGLHVDLGELAQRKTAGPVAAAPAVHPQLPIGPEGAGVLRAQEVEKPPTAGVQFVLARVGADGSLGERFPLDHPGMIVGRQGEIPLPDDPLVAPEHARFTQLGDAVYVEDLGSPQSVFLRLREPRCLRDGDIIVMGAQKLRFDLQATTAPSPEGAFLGRTPVMGASPTVVNPQPALVRLDAENREADRYPLRAPETFLGRSKATYTFPEDRYMSTTHARIKLQDSQYFLEDLASTNGTFVRIRKRFLARDGDTLLLGSQLLRVLAAKPSPASD